MAKVCLNLGCGNDYRESTNEVKWINADKGDCKVDARMDIEWGIWPFEESSFDEIYAIQVLEHINPERFPDVVREMYRISKSDALWHIAVPHGFSDNFITDPTHRMHYSTRTFDYFIEGAQLRENGVIYGWSDISLEHAIPPQIDRNMSIIFELRVKK